MDMLPADFYPDFRKVSQEVGGPLESVEDQFLTGVDHSIPAGHGQPDFPDEGASSFTALPDHFDINQNNSTHDEQYAGSIASAPNSLGVWYFPPAIPPAQHIPSPIPIPMAPTPSISGYNHAMEYHQPPNMDPFTQLYFPVTNSNNSSSAQALYSSHQNLNFLPSTKTSPPPASQTHLLASTARNTKASLNQKTHRCLSCDLRFVRNADLQRHIQNLHLGIRHHCRKLGCSNNHGRGYCRLEKLKKHLLDKHSVL